MSSGISKSGSTSLKSTTVLKSTQGDYILLNDEESRESGKRQEPSADLTLAKEKLLELETRLKGKFSQIQKLETALEKALGL